VAQELAKWYSTVNHDEAHRDRIEQQLRGELPFPAVEHQCDGKYREKAGTACSHGLWDKKQQSRNCLNGCEYADMNIDAIPACRERVPSCLNAVHDQKDAECPPEGEKCASNTF
jgi:hypothetical protein